MRKPSPPPAPATADDERRRAILRARALALAAEPEAGPGAAIEVLEFALGRERYLVETAWVREVIPLRELTPLPCTPAFVLGIVALRGRVVSVLDLGKFFGLPDRGLGELDRVVVLGDGTMEFGLLADAVSGVRPLPLAVLQEPLPTLTGIHGEYLMGVTPQREVVLDGRRLLNDPALVVAEEAGLPEAGDERSMS